MKHFSRPNLISHIRYCNELYEVLADQQYAEWQHAARDTSIPLKERLEAKESGPMTAHRTGMFHHVAAKHPHWAAEWQGRAYVMAALSTAAMAAHGYLEQRDGVDEPGAVTGRTQINNAENAGMMSGFVDPIASQAPELAQTIGGFPLKSTWVLKQVHEAIKKDPKTDRRGTRRDRFDSTMLAVAVIKQWQIGIADPLNQFGENLKLLRPVIGPQVDFARSLIKDGEDILLPLLAHHQAVVLPEVGFAAAQVVNAEAKRSRQRVSDIGKAEEVLGEWLFKKVSPEPLDPSGLDYLFHDVRRSAPDVVADLLVADGGRPKFGFSF